MTTDIHRFRDGMFPIMQMLVAPLVIAVTLGVLISVVGPITLSGFGILLIIIPMSAVFGIKLGKAQKNKVWI